MKKLFAILFLFVFVSCKQKVNSISVNDFDKQYFFGFEYKPFIDSNLYIPDSLRIYNEQLGEKLLWRFYISDSSTCFMDNDNIFIRAFYNADYKQCTSFLIKINKHYFESKYRYCPTAPICGTGEPRLTSIGERLILNKPKYEINDTVKGKLLLKYYVDNEYIKIALRDFQ